MRTSNRILFTLLVVIFSTPLFLFMAFKTMIKNGEYTTVENNPGNYQTRSFSNDLKVLKLVGPDNQVLTCNLIPADTSSYSEENYYGQDSIKVEQRGDTLVVRYVDVKENENSANTEQIHRKIDIRSNSFNTIVAAGATINMDAVNTTANPDIYFDLKNNARLQLGKTGTTEMNTFEQTEQPDDTVANPTSGIFKKLFINAHASNISIEKSANIGELNMQIQGLSIININNDSKIGHLSGSISDSSTVNANWQNVRKLAALTK